MEFSQRINVLTQSAELVQAAGLLTLEEAYNTKVAIDSINNNYADLDSVNVLIQVAEKGRKKGVFVFQDCYYIFLAIDGIEKEVATFRQSTQDAVPTVAEEAIF